MIQETRILIIDFENQGDAICDTIEQANDYLAKKGEHTDIDMLVAYEIVRELPLVGTIRIIKEDK